MHYNRKLTTTKCKIMPTLIRFYSVYVYQNTMSHTTNTHNFYLWTQNKDNNFGNENKNPTCGVGGGTLGGGDRGETVVLM